MSLSLETSHNIFFLYAVTTKPSGSHAKSEKNTCFYHAPTAVETAENMAALNVDYIAWIITVLGTINSNHTFIFDLNYLLWVKNFEETSGKFLARNETQSFSIKTKPIPRMPVQDAKSSLKILVANAQLSVAFATGWS